MPGHRKTIKADYGRLFWRAVFSIEASLMKMQSHGIIDVKKMDPALWGLNP